MATKGQTKKLGRLFLAENLGGGHAIIVAPDKKSALELLRTYVRESGFHSILDLVVIRELSLIKPGVISDKLSRA